MEEATTTLVARAIAISIELVPDAPAERPGTWDRLTFYWLLLITCYLCSLDIAALYYYRRYEPLRSKSVGKLVLSSVFAIVHMWALFVINEQSETVRDWKQLGCDFWAFWVQYLIGLNSWFVFMLERTVTYGYLFLSPLLQPMARKASRVKIFKLALASLLSFPIFIICLLVTLEGGSYVDQQTATCVTELKWKLCILAWVTTDFGVLIWLNSYVNQQQFTLKNQYFNENQELRVTVLIGIVGLAGYVLVNFFGLESYSLYRSLQTMLIGCMYMCVHSSFLCPRLYRAWIQDEVYAADFHRAADPHQYLTLPDDARYLLHSDEQVRLSEFLKFCQQQGRFTLSFELLHDTPSPHEVFRQLSYPAGGPTSRLMEHEPSLSAADKQEQQTAPSSSSSSSSLDRFFLFSSHNGKFGLDQRAMFERVIKTYQSQQSLAGDPVNYVSALLAVLELEQLYYYYESKEWSAHVFQLVAQRFFDPRQLDTFVYIRESTLRNLIHKIAMSMDENGAAVSTPDLQMFDVVKYDIMDILSASFYAAFKRAYAERVKETQPPDQIPVNLRNANLIGGASSSSESNASLELKPVVFVQKQENKKQ
jgi:hypothetical protein